MADADLSEILKRLASLEAEGDIRRVIARYMEICDALGPGTPWEELGHLFTVDAVWRGVGARYDAAFGTCTGRRAIVDMLKRYSGPPPHFAFNAHFLTSEAIAVQGEEATGVWMMLQTSTYAGGHSDLRAARLSVGFAKTGRQWQIARFETENLFGRGIARWDDAVPFPVPVPDASDRDEGIQHDQDFN